jgi:hypothetical protein
MYVDKVIVPVIVLVVGALLLSLIPKRKLTRPLLRWVAVVVLLVLAGGIVYFFPPDSKKSAAKTDDVIAGTIVEASTGASIRGASINVVGGPEISISESNGNFRLKLNSGAATPDFVRLHIEKPGYFAYDTSVRPGEHSVVVQLERATK